MTQASRRAHTHIHVASFIVRELAARIAESDASSQNGAASTFGADA